MHYIEDSAATDQDLIRALRRIRRRLAARRWVLDGSGRIRCELLPPVDGYPRRMCCPLGMLAAEAPRTRLDRTLQERENADWKAAVTSFVDLEIRPHVQALARKPGRLRREEHAERGLVRLGVALAVSTMPSDPASESILALEAATVRLLSEASERPDSRAGILLARSLRTEGNTLAEDYRERFRRTLAEAAAVSRAARAVIRRRIRELGSDADDGRGGLAPDAAARTPAAPARDAVLGFGAGLWRILAGDILSPARSGRRTS